LEEHGLEQRMEHERSLKNLLGRGKEDQNNYVYERVAEIGWPSVSY